MATSDPGEDTSRITRTVNVLTLQLAEAADEVVQRVERLRARRDKAKTTEHALRSA